MLVHHKDKGGYDMKKGIFSSRFLSVLCLGLAVSLFFGAKKAKKVPEPLIKESILDGMKWRCIGPSNMGGRIDDFAVVESNPKIIYAGTASGGVWKTINNGVTWECGRPSITAEPGNPFSTTRLPAPSAM